MLMPNINSADQVTDEQAAYLAGIAQTLSAQDDFAIQNFADTTITSPDAQQALQSENALGMLEDMAPQDVAFDIFNPMGNEGDAFALSSYQENSIFTGLWDRIKVLFSGLRRKVQRVFCKVVTALGSDEALDIKKIIKDVLVALIPALAAASGLMPVALPLVVSLAAMLFKYRVSKVYPA